jgi:hypothetical protein
VIESLRKKASFTEDQFKIGSSIFSFRRGSRVEGKVFTEGDFTVVQATVLPSVQLKIFPFLILLLAFAVFIVVLAGELKRGKFDFKIFLFIPGAMLLAIFSYSTMRVNFLVSHQAQESLLKHLVQ